ncbi:potassium channel family protein [Mycobacterium sp. Y57]|uniref:potassium channel family protein n=1 Tax=Mycolicibacterium xanthum TaxID=2796469 RepID=UPI001C86232A|nr:potassium channel family protein [Mycolicibacterium xanthum]MBX7435285.1 potassium channel family protein [Mycolicibacterium xanthum]
MALVLTLFLLITLLLVDTVLGRIDSAVALGVTGLSTALTLQYSLQASGLAGRYQVMVAIAVGIGLMANLALIIMRVMQSDIPDHQGRWEVRALGPVWVLIALLTPLASNRRLLKHRRVSLNTLFAAVASYLQIAIGFALLYQVIDSYSSEPFFGRAVPSTVYMYYSLTTISTLGFGDFTAATNLGRAASVTEALMGQIYLVIVVAMLVGLFIGSRDTKPDRG